MFYQGPIHTICVHSSIAEADIILKQQSSPISVMCIYVSGFILSWL